jgi:hypothetical protein
MSYSGEGVVARARRFATEAFGFRGSRNLTAWAVAGVAAYFMFYLPERQRAIEIQVCCERGCVVCVSCAGQRPARVGCGMSCVGG